LAICGACLALSRDIAAAVLVLHRPVDRISHLKELLAQATAAARHAGTKAIGVVLFGLSVDGSRGLAAYTHHGGRVMVVEPTGHGMPENAIA
jgi:chemotaxis response regulator CheB